MKAATSKDNHVMNVGKLSAQSRKVSRLLKPLTHTDGTVPGGHPLRFSVPGPAGRGSSPVPLLSEFLHLRAVDLLEVSAVEKQQCVRVSHGR